MPMSFIDPYTGDEGETCSVSFNAQQEVIGGSSVTDPQTEAEFNKSKLLGEWGVIKGKLAKGDIKDGTKVLQYTSGTGGRGFLYVKGGKLFKKAYFADGGSSDNPIKPDDGDKFINLASFKASIPQATAAKPKPEPDVGKVADSAYMKKAYQSGDVIVAETQDGQYQVHWIEDGEYYAVMQKEDDGVFNEVFSSDVGGIFGGMKQFGVFYEADGYGIKATKTSPAPPSQVAAPVAATPVDSASPSVGSMSHEDVSALFVKIKDDLAKEQGLNIKGANPALDVEVYAAIGKLIGYTPDEVKGKIDAYKAAGNKLSALKKKVLAGTYKVPTSTQAAKGTAPQPTKASPAAPLNTSTKTSKPVQDPKPNGVPTVATPKVAAEAKEEVKKVVAAEPAKVYSDEDVAAAYIIAKDAIVATNDKGWTLYTKNDEFDLEIAIQVGLKTGLNPTQQKQAIANYLGGGKKLSVLKKQLIKQGAMKPQADTLKSKSPAPKDAAAKKEDIADKAAAGYTPTPPPVAPATKTKPKMETGKTNPKSVEKDLLGAGDIDWLSNISQNNIFADFKLQGHKSYLSSGPAANYEALLAVYEKFKDYPWASGKLTLLQVIRVVDAKGAEKAGVANGNLFEKQTVEWLTSPTGTRAVQEMQAKAAAKAQLEKDLKEAEANQPPLPADSAQFEPWSLDKARQVSRTWLDAKPWDDKQQRDLKHYTGNAYTEMNTYLRKGKTSSISARSKSAIKGAQDGMRPTTEPILVQRGSGASQFSALGLKNGDGALTFGLTGKTFKDEGFLSTSAGGRAAFAGKEVQLEIECPVGTPMAYVAPISKYPHENEMLLQAGLEYKILNVRKQDGTYVVRMRVVNWPGKG